MLYKRNLEAELDSELFRNPPVEYRGIPFWSWNCKVTEKIIDEQLSVFQEMGFGGVDIHPRTGMDIEYLGEEYQKLIQYTVQKCKEMGLICWLYDEDRFPSGSAGGIVTKNFRFRGRFLLLTEKRFFPFDGYYGSKEEFEEAIDFGRRPKGYYAAAYGLLFEDGRLKSYRRLEQEEAIRLSGQSAEKIRFAYVKLMEEEGWFEDQAYVDTMNPEAIAEFIKVTHEAYYRWVGEDFGTAVPAIFTDEPRLGKHVQISRAMSGEDVTMPYTECFANAMIEQYGIDPLDIVPEYVWELVGGEFSQNRYRYRNFAAECFISAYMDQICEWCKAHQIAMTGHVLSEDTLSSQAFALGDCMRCYRNMDIPGIDILVDKKEFAAAKQASSVSRQNGREGTLSELYGVTHWDCSFKTFKLQGDWQTALGITIRIPHLSHMSLQGEAKRDWPGSIFFQAPWYQEYPYIENHFSRLNTVMTRGNAIVSIGVIHPVESLWMYLGPDDQTLAVRQEMDEDFSNLVRWMLFGTLDFDFLSEALMPDQCRDFINTPDKHLAVGKMKYTAVVVPNMTTIRSTTLDILESFHKAGGYIVFMGKIPQLVDGEKSDRAYRLAEKCMCIGKERTDLYDALKNERTVEIRKKNGTYSDNLFYQMRQDNTCKWLFVCHVNNKEQHVSELEQYEISIRGHYLAKRYDTQTGEIRPVPIRQNGKNTVISCGLYAEDSVLYRLEEDKICCENNALEMGGKPMSDEYKTVEKLTDVISYQNLEKNVLLLDYAQYRFDDGEKHKREEILRLDNQIRKQLGFVIRQERMNQPYHMEEKEEHTVTLYYSFESEISVPVQLAIEKPEICRIWLNQKEADRTPVGYYVDPAISVITLPDLKKGLNELTIQVVYNQKTNLENIYVLGDFHVELRGNHAVIGRKRQKLFIGDITGQGMPFYTGNLEYTFDFTVEREVEYYVHVPHFKAPLLSVYVDGSRKGLIAYSPHRCSLGSLKKGVHELVICVYGNRFNGFGTLHNANDNFEWWGPDSYRTRGDDWTDSYRIRPMGILSAVEIQM